MNDSDFIYKTSLITIQCNCKMSAQLIADMVWEELKPKLEGVAVGSDVQKLTTQVEKLTVQLEEQMKKFEEHTELMNKKFEKQKRYTTWGFHLLFLLPCITAVVNLGIHWMVMMGFDKAMMKAMTRIDETEASRWDPSGEAPPNTRVFCQYINRTDSDGTVMWDGILSAWNYTQHLYNATK